MEQAHLFAIGVLLAWLAGIRVYLTVFGVGLAGVLGWVELPPALHRYQPVLNKLLHKDPNQRFQTGQEFIAALDHPETLPAVPHCMPTQRVMLLRA